MIAFDEDALICDLAETYNIYDYRQMPLKMVSVLSVGLREDSRIKMKMNKQNVSMDMLLKAAIVDDLNILIWQRTKDGAKGKNKPKSMVAKLLNKDNDFKELKKLDLGTFDSIDEYKLFIASKAKRNEVES